MFIATISTSAGTEGEALGFGSVLSGLLVRPSYRADKQRHAADTGRGAVSYLTDPGVDAADQARGPAGEDPDR